MINWIFLRIINENNENHTKIDEGNDFWLKLWLEHETQQLWNVIRPISLKN